MADLSPRQPLINTGFLDVAVLQVNDAYSNPGIVLLSYPPESLVDLSMTQDQFNNYLQYITTLYQQAQQQGMSNVYQFQLDGTNLPLDNWCVDHPSTAAHQVMANQLIQYIQATFPDWGNSTYPLLTDQ